MNVAATASCVGYIWNIFIPSLAITPHDDIGAGIPSPKRERKASVNITDGISRVMFTIITLSMLGTRCLFIMRDELAPMV